MEGHAPILEKLTSQINSLLERLNQYEQGFRKEQEQRQMLIQALEQKNQELESKNKEIVSLYEEIERLEGREKEKELELENLANQIQLRLGGTQNEQSVQQQSY
ncbi:hypothetical protein CCZ01_05190 [Helicobacter monodelphidis]|uniref:hypothetical protein n=1 Tax=Helicobacter sp. 15-1451 TaxID=2004995 RepID=UPI000DCF289D|nr:hypothetical protein [Helicobacter sp. 15-1451]RAX57683.1 hypothetical protein CCZ01_05190 [Helicobacter sp. 15-1451]